MPPDISEIAVLFSRLSRSADEPALWKLHKLYYHRLYRFVFAFVGIKEPAEEIVNDVFLAIWLKRHLLQGVAKPEVYLFVCAKNMVLKHGKKKKVFTASLNDLYDFDCVVERNPYDIMISTELLRRINEAIQSLPPQCKLIFSLVKENNLKYREVAGLLDLSEKTIENQMGIALKKLNQSIPLSFSS